MNNKGFIIAIDGPAAAGKGTISPVLAEKLNGFYLYTGAMYRCLALLCIENGVDTKDEQSVIDILPKFNIDFSDGKVLLNGTDVTERIKKEDVANGSSDVSSIKKVREEMVPKQRDAVKGLLNKGVTIIAEGRDTATKIFPNADLKIFLTADSKVRAKRRISQLEDLGEEVEFEQVYKNVLIRDEKDTTRDTDPLSKNPEEHGYFVLDNSDMTEEETVDAIINEVNKIKND
jgi:CMP/dCMP kinase